MPVAKEQIRQIISENNLNSVTDVYALLRDSFKDILQELMEAEMDATLGYEKNRKGVLQTDNKRNGHSPKNLKSQYGEFQIDVPRDRNGELVLVYKCGQKKLNNLYYQVKEQRRRSTWRKTKNLTLRNLNNRLWICIMPEEPRIHNWNVNMA